MIMFSTIIIGYRLSRWRHRIKLHECQENRYRG